MSRTVMKNATQTSASAFQRRGSGAVADKVPPELGISAQTRSSPGLFRPRAGRASSSENLRERIDEQVVAGAVSDRDPNRSLQPPHRQPAAEQSFGGSFRA